MARDYARERRYRGRKQSGASSWRWLAAGLILGLIVAAILYVKESSQSHKKAPGHKSQEIKKTTPAHKKPQHAAKQKPAETAPETQFDFYTVLPKMSVETPKTETTSPSTNNKKTAPHANDQYLLRVGAVKSYDKADQLKAELIMRGFDVSIQKILINKETYYRINVGPFSSREEAINQQKALQKEQIPTTVFKLPSNNL